MTVTRAVILSAGLGTRLRPLTDDLPKVLLPVGDEPLLHRLLDLCREAGVREVAFNVHHFGEKVRASVGDGERWNMTARYYDESSLLGSAGALRNMAPWLSQGGPFFVLYGDVLIDEDLRALGAAHRPIMTVALTTADDPTRCGVATLDLQDRLIDFTEKPRTAPADALVNAGALVCEPEILDRIPDGVADLGAHLIPALVASGRPVYGFRSTAYYQDIGTPEGYRAALATFAEGRTRCPSS